LVALTIWRAGILLEAIILYRGVRTGLLSKYPFFYAYIASVLVADSSLYIVRLLDPSLYSRWDPIAALLSLVLGYGIILEIFRHVLMPYRGVERLARVGGMVIAGVILSFAIFYPIVTSGISRGFSIVRVERDFWAVQAIFLFGIFTVIVHYGIPTGRNLKGMMFGYALCLAATVMALALQSYIGSSFQAARGFIETFSYLASLSIWIAALWSDHPSPVPGHSDCDLQADYESLVLRTQGMMGVMRSHLTKVARP
jgi:hypothetical protein